MKYKYFVSFSHGSKTKAGFGNLQISLSCAIKSINDINKVQKMIEEDINFENSSIVIINFILLEVTE